MTDAAVQHRTSTGGLARALGLQVLLGLILAPFALVRAVINALPFLVVKLVGLLRIAPSIQSTIKPIVAFMAFGATWVVVVWTAATRFGPPGAAAAAVLLPLYLAATVLLVERLVLVVRVLRRWRVAERVGPLPDRLRDDRQAVVEAALAA